MTIDYCILMLPTLNGLMPASNLVENFKQTQPRKLVKSVEYFRRGGSWRLKTVRNQDEPSWEGHRRIRALESSWEELVGEDGAVVGESWEGAGKDEQAKEQGGRRGGRVLKVQGLVTWNDFHCISQSFLGLLEGNSSVIRQTNDSIVELLVNVNYRGGCVQPKSRLGAPLLQVQSRCTTPPKPNQSFGPHQLFTIQFVAEGEFD